MSGTANHPSFDAEAHWQSVWTAKASSEVSWHRPHLETSLALIRAAGAARDAGIIDVGGGASTLVDALLDQGFAHVTVLDIASAALDRARARLGPRAAAVIWIAGDVTSVDPGGPFDLWHDRAVFHFLTAARDRDAYAATLRSALRPGGHAVMATFGPDGPTTCSGLPVVRYDADALLAALGAGLRLVESRYEDHLTPAGNRQQFLHALLRCA